MNLTPDFATFAHAWGAGKNQTVSTAQYNDTETPVSAMYKLCHNRAFSFLLESAEGGALRGRYSIIGRDPDLIWQCQHGKGSSINRHALTSKEKFKTSSQTPLEDLRALLTECHIDDVNQPQPIAAGLFGYLSYDMVQYMEKLPTPQPIGVETPEALLIRPTLLAIFDNVENRIIVVTPVWYDKSQTAEQAYQLAKERIAQANQDLASAMVSPPDAKIGPAPLPEPKSNMTEAKFCKSVERAKEYICAGDIFQVVLSQRFSLPFKLPPFSLYRSIRRLDPSPFLFYFNLKDFHIVGTSPEILVRVRDGQVTIRPIAGTRPRGFGNQSDTELAADLLADPKELAEHLMLLDLGRNDVGRVAKIGSVKVTARNTIEYYKHVMHIVSNVEGQLDSKYTSLDALIAGFPAGTVSGAPKVRAMEIIAELEADRRGVYAGCIGYFGANGNMDTAIAIRTAVIKDNVMHVQAGAGIVYDSHPQSEYRECVAKARGLIRAAQQAAECGNSFDD